MPRTPPRHATRGSSRPRGRRPRTDRRLERRLRRGFDLQRVVGLRQRHHDRIELVVAVGTYAGDAQRQRQLRERIDAHHSALSLAQSSSDSVSARAEGSIAARVNVSPSTRPSSARAQSLAPRREPGPHEREQADGIRDSHRRFGVPLEPHEHALDPRRRQEHRGRHPPDHLRVGEVRDLHRDRPVRVVAGPGRESLAHLPLHHHEEAVDHGRPLECLDDDRRRDVVRKVRDHRVAPVPEQATASRRAARRPSRSRCRARRSPPPAPAARAGRLRSRARARRRRAVRR